MYLKTLLGTIPLWEFAQRYFHCLPLAIRETGLPLCELATSTVWDEILSQSAADILIARGGQQLSAKSPRSAVEGRKLLDQGCTIVVRRAELLHSDLAEIAAAFEKDFRAPIDVQYIVTPAGEQGFTWHYDAEDVFIIQIGGVKDYSLRKNTVQPWPLRETIPTDMRYGEEIMPYLRASLSAGDWLYIPCGYWHRAASPTRATTPSISLAVGVMSPAGVHVVDHLRSRLCSSLRWRQRLPTVGDATTRSHAQLVEEMQVCLRQLSVDLQQLLADPRLVEELVAGEASKQLLQVRPPVVAARSLEPRLPQ